MGYMTKKMQGIITPLITPFKDKKIDYDAVYALSHFLIRSGVSAAFPGSSTGGFPLLSTEEQIEVIRAFHEGIGGKIPLLPGVGRNAVGETVEVARAAVKLGADVVVVVTPYYLRLDQDSIYRYFDAVASKVESDILLYNIPQFTGNTIEVSTVKRLVAAHDNIIGIKDSSGDFRLFSGFAEALPKGFLLYQGQDDLLLSSIKLGASGGICGTTNFSKLAVEVYESYSKGKVAKANELQGRLTEIMKVLGSVPFPLGYNYLFYKIVLGKDETNAVPPLHDLDKETAKSLASKIGALLKND